MTIDRTSESYLRDLHARVTCRESDDMAADIAEDVSDFEEIYGGAYRIDFEIEIDGEDVPFTVVADRPIVYETAWRLARQSAEA